MSLDQVLQGRVALVTGASRGIGKAIAQELARHGAKVAINFHEREREADAVAASIAADGGDAIAVKADVAMRAAVEAMVDEITARLGAIELLVNNAGIAIRRGIEDLSETDFDRTVAVNLKSAFLCTQAVVPAMRKRRFGRIVNISSGAARGAGIVGLHYNASKAGLEGLTRGYAARLAAEGITVNAVAPSLIETDMMRTRSRDDAPKIPIGRMGTPAEVAQAVVMVMTNPYMTGQTIQLNGGLHFN
jgi:3-oxoacyl-[acyl-carrier protein] reductase